MRCYRTVLLVAAMAGLAGCQSKVLFVTSYDRDEAVTKEALFAFRTALDRSRTHDAAVDVHEMQWDRRTSPTLRSEFGEMARVQTLSSRAKAVICLSEVAIQEVAAKLSSTNITFIACGMKSAPAAYGFAMRDNVIGIFGRPSLLTCMKQVLRVAPSAKRLGILGDGGPMTIAMAAEADVLEKPPMTVSGVETAKTQVEWLAALVKLQQKSDAILVAGTDVVQGDGGTFPLTKLAAMTGEQCRVPTIGLQREAVMEGGLMMAYAASPRSIGRLAAGYVLQILNREPVQEITPRYTEPGCDLYLNLPLAEKVGVIIPKDVLETATGLFKAGSKNTEGQPGK